MKKALATILAASILFTVFSCGKKKEGFSIEGTIKATDSAWILLKKRDEGKFVTIDSVQPKNGSFKFEGKVDMPEIYFIALKGLQDVFPFFVENSQLSLTVYPDSLDKSVLTGSVTNDEYLAYQKEENSFYDKLADSYHKFTTAKETGDSILMKKAEAEYDTVSKQQAAFTKNYILKNGKSVVAAYVALSNAYAFGLKDMELINKALDPSLAQSVYVKKLAEREDILRKVEPGQPAPAFSMNDTTGKTVSPADFRGKVLLIDFWASWCGPCRRENPNVVAAYNKYHAKGFTVLGVSLDDSRDKWIEAIAKDHLTWTHVSDLAGWSNAAAKMYGVMSIPSNFLLDKEGKILAKDLDGEKLEQKLAEVFGE